MKKLVLALGLVGLASCALLSGGQKSPDEEEDGPVNAPPGTRVVITGINTKQPSRFWSITVDVVEQRIVSEITGPTTELDAYLGRLARSPCDSQGCRVVSTFVSPLPPRSVTGMMAGAVVINPPDAGSGADAGSAVDGGVGPIPNTGDPEDPTGKGIPGDNPKTIRFAIRVYRSYQINIAQQLNPKAVIPTAP
jgi:hypothetical protein